MKRKNIFFILSILLSLIEFYSKYNDVTYVRKNIFKKNNVFAIEFF